MFEAQIARGVAVLDAKVPGWRDRVRADILNMESPSRCILGQVRAGYGGYWGESSSALVGVPHSTSFNRHNGDLAPFGFSLDTTGAKDRSDDWDQLTAEWRAELAKVTQ